MTTEVLLHQIASARAGDKGNTSSISVWAYDRSHYEDMKAALTPSVLKAAFGSQFQGEITRYEMDGLAGLNFVLREALDGGVNSSLNLDFHGKSFSYIILGLPVKISGVLAGGAGQAG